MMPVAKMYTAKKAILNASEGIECFGAQGYIEDTGTISDRNRYQNLIPNYPKYWLIFYAVK